MASRLPRPGGDNGNWGAILNDYLAQAHGEDGVLKPGSVNATTIADGTIPQTKLTTTLSDKIDAAATGVVADGAITTVKIADGAITTAKVASGGLAPSAVTGTAIVANDTRLTDTRTPTDASVTTVKLAAGSVTAAKITDGTITPAKLDTATQTNLTKASTALQAADIAGKADASALAATNSTVSANTAAIATKAADSAVVHLTGAETISGAKNFTGGLQSAGTNVVISSDTRLTDTRTPTDGSVTTAKLATGAVTAAAIADGTITAAKLNTAANNLLAAAQTAVQSVNGKSGTAVSLTASDVAAVPTTQLGAVSGVATLDGSGKLVTGQLPSSLVNGTGAPRLRGRSDRSHVFIAGVIRNYDDAGNGLGASGWEKIRTFHPDMNLVSVDSLTDTGLINLDTSSAGALRAVSLIAVCDETLTKAGFTCGTSVTPTSTNIQLRLAGEMADRVDAIAVATLSSTLSTGAAITSLPVNALAGAIKAGEFITLNDAIGPPPHRQVWQVTADAAAGATSIAVVSQTPNFAFPSGTTTGWVYRTWKAVNGGAVEPSPFTIESVANNHLTIAHQQVPKLDRFTHSLQRIGGPGENYAPVVSTSIDPADLQRFAVDFFDDSGSRVLAPDARCRVITKRGQNRTWYPPNLVNETTYPSGNIWIFGIHQVEALD